jgi:CheY-like chemotaxis protein
MATILVIDDDPDMILAARLCMESAGHTVIEAADGSEGLEKIKEQRPDLIILDVMMDTTTEGFQFAIKLRSPDPTSPYAQYANIPIIMLTAIHSTTSLRFGPDEDYLPVDAFVEKPFDPDQLIDQVNELLNR